MNVGEQMSLFDLGLWSSKMSQEFSVPMAEKTSELSSKRRQGCPIVTPQFLDLRTGSPGLLLGVFWQTDGLSLGDYMTHSFGVSPKEEVESHLWQILEEPTPQNCFLKKYALSPRACQGILNRAEKQGKELPKILEEALKLSVSKNEQDVTGGVKEFSFKETEPEPCPPPQISSSQMVAIEGNGSRPSHRGEGFCESDVSYTLNTLERHSVAYSQDAYDKYSETDVSAALKRSGGNFGGYGNHSETIGALCSRDFKGVGNQYVKEGKIIVQDI